MTIVIRQKPIFSFDKNNRSEENEIENAANYKPDTIELLRRNIYIYVCVCVCVCGFQMTLSRTGCDIGLILCGVQLVSIPS